MDAGTKAIVKQEVETLKENKVIRDFVESAAYQQIAEDINRLSPGRCCTAKGARLLVHRHDNKDMASRWLEYVAAGYLGVLVGKYFA